ncbi:hypothetical protein OG218_17630 [Kineococcus sp. NBC_00420]|uniref:hypothetical protein n=1 Tax=Kineococcus sp. NBC_00420 TaxID=2903564 RepID=UPI002E245D23
MSSVLHPVGPEDKGIYWRRRLVTIVVLLVVIVLAVVGIRALTATDDAAAQGQKLDPSHVASTLTAAPGPSTSPGATPTDSPTDSPADSPTGSATGSPTATGTGAVAPCEPAALTVALTSDATTYGPGKAPRFVVTVTNTSQTACTAEIGSGVRGLVATDASGAQVWSTADCEASTASQVYTIQPSKNRAMTTVWSRLHSAAGCPPDQQAVADGNYTVTATWDQIVTAPLTIALTS